MLVIAGVFAMMAIVVSFLHIFNHLRNWTLPEQQRYIIRIILMVPIYSIDSWLSLRFHEHSLYFDIVRDCYEAYVLYQFFSLLVSYIENGAPGNLEEILKEKPSRTHPCPLCCLPSFRPGPLFLLITKQFILQYVIIKPLMACIAGGLQFAGLYEEGSFSYTHGYMYIAGITNISVTLSMYFLVLFYLVTEPELSPNQPVAKFICIKSILFFSFWQSVAIGIASYFNLIPELGDWKKEEIATALQDFIICIEMFVLATAHMLVFPYQPYRDRPSSHLTIAEIKGSVRNFTTVIDQEDILNDLNIYRPIYVSNAKRQQKELIERDISLSLLQADHLEPENQQEKDTNPNLNIN
uniref:Transmembrane protein 184C n=1 Tax=Arcella intermedia TaxID=1963864 RepID=A0A6B2L8Y6_9EUKA